MGFGSSGDIQEIRRFTVDRFFDGRVGARNIESLGERAGFDLVDIDDGRNLGLWNSRPAFGLELGEVAGADEHPFGRDSIHGAPQNCRPS